MSAYGDLLCGFTFPDGHRCSWFKDEHIHQPAETCPNGPTNAARHHDYIPRPDHVHEFGRCVCGATQAAANG